ncbi:hypothetical protein N7491_009543 [Penicillium cf. griseofulvum]|uniref:Uncharacterized protein n=1 Tax=Penicillium cf. griseofulvum TaxID=2972120 RepID=A0A9W9MF73_9EURO|nr:hypothetical protein N7472_004863 [Penicillium cf. griseofulvum]KAJ5424327.1 hypothetical protein N7491_009543 [Penicillium cf. griseofulvum]KAJ5442431.1 hypothetical protein N7445_005438 [Penicillium cf. griseofulvum]
MPVEVINEDHFYIPSLFSIHSTVELAISLYHLKEGLVRLLDETFRTLLNFLILLEVQGGLGASDARSQNRNKAAYMPRHLRLI